MKISEARKKLISMAAEYFGNGHVFWADAKMTKLPEPYVTLQVTGMSRQVNPNVLVDDDGYPVSYRDIVLDVDLNLYTKGKSVRGSSVVFENTSMEDLIDFMDYLDSEQGQYEQEKAGMAVTVESDPQDLSALIREAQYQYRAQISLSVRITDSAYGDYGQNGKTLPNASGGGNSGMVTEPSVIETVEICEDRSE